MHDFPGDPIRIARIVSRLGVGGSERYVCSLTAHLDKRKYQSWLICGRIQKTERECSEFLTESGISPIYIDQLRRGLGPWDLRASLKLNRLLARIEPQIVETHAAKAGALGRIISRLRLTTRQKRIRLIHMFHGHVFHGYFSDPVTRAFIAIERQLARLTDVIVTVSPAVRRELIEEYRIADAEKVRVIPLGFDFGWVSDLPRHKGWLRARLGASDSTVIFGTVGRLAKIKNTELVLRAFSRLLRQEHLDARLVIIGDGELLGTLQSQACELAIDDHVLFCSWVLDRAKIFSDLDVTCLSSFNEGSPVCLIESLAAGVPVVATEVGGVADVVARGLDGELVESGNEEAFAAALSTVAHSKCRLPIDRRLAVCSKYSIGGLMKNIENLYSEVLDNDQMLSIAGERRLGASSRI